MTRMRFESRQTLDPTTGLFATNAAVQIFAMSDTAYSSPLTIYDTAGVAFSNKQLVVGSVGTVATFDVDDQDQVRWKSGSYTGVWTSYTAQSTAINAAKDSAAAAASSAAASQAAAQALSDQVTALINGQSSNPSGGGLDQTALAAALINYPQMWFQNSDGTWPARPLDTGAVLAIVRPGKGFPPDPLTGQTNISIVQQAS